MVGESACLVIFNELSAGTIDTRCCTCSLRLGRNWGWEPDGTGLLPGRSASAGKEKKESSPCQALTTVSSGPSQDVFGAGDQASAVITTCLLARTWCSCNACRLDRKPAQGGCNAVNAGHSSLSCCSVTLMSSDCFFSSGGWTGFNTLLPKTRNDSSLLVTLPGCLHICIRFRTFAPILGIVIFC